MFFIVLVSGFGLQVDKAFFFLCSSCMWSCSIYIIIYFLTTILYYVSYISLSVMLNRVNGIGRIMKFIGNAE